MADVAQRAPSDAAVADERALLDAQHRRNRRRSRTRVLGRIGVLAALLVFWQVLSLQVSPILMPSFTATLGALGELVTDDVLYRALLVSSQALVIGYGMAIVVGVTFGVLMGLSRFLGDALDPFLTITLATPISALVPVFIVIFGLSLGGRIAIVFVFTVMYVTVNTLAGVRSVTPDLVEMGRAYMLSRRQLLRWIVLPSAAPLIVAGIRIGYGRAVVGMLLSEMLMVAVGLGGMLLQFGNELRSPHLFATIIVVLFFAVAGGTAIQWLERRIGRWNRPA